MSSGARALLWGLVILIVLVSVVWITNVYRAG